MTYAEELKQEGIKKGIQLGKQEGIQIGEHIAQLKISGPAIKSRC